MNMNLIIISYMKQLINRNV